MHYSILNYTPRYNELKIIDKMLHDVTLSSIDRPLIIYIIIFTARNAHKYLRVDSTPIDDIFLLCFFCVINNCMYMYVECVIRLLPTSVFLLLKRVMIHSIADG